MRGGISTRILKRTGLVLGTLLLVLLFWYLFIFDWDDLTDHFTTAVGDRTRREFSVGKMNVHLSLTPRISLEGVRLENAPWSTDPRMVEIESLEFTLKLLPLLLGRVVLPEVVLREPRIVLERNDQGVPNWEFSAVPGGKVAVETAVPEARGEFPVIGHVLVSDGRVEYRDAARNIHIEGKVNTAIGLSDPGQEAIRLEAHGHFQGLAASLNFTGASLLALREEEEPYPFQLQAQVGETRIAAKGTAVDPVRGEGLRIQMDLEGRDLSEVFPLFGIPFPPTRPYRVAGKLSREAGQWIFKNFAGTIGESDLAGDLRLDFAADPPHMRGQFVSKQLQLSELAGFFGVRPAPEPRAKDRLIPDTPINLERLHAMNMDVEFRAEHVIAATVPAQRVEYRLRLQDGVLSFAPLKFDVARGTIEGEVHLDANREQPHLAANLTLRHLRLGRFLPKLQAAGMAYGTFGGRVRLEGSGNDLRQIFADGDGGFWLSMSGGALDEIVIAAAGVDVPDLLRLLGTEKTPVPLRCSVIAFDLSEGILHSTVVVIDAQESTLFGEGTVSLRDESVDLKFDAEAKEAGSLTVGGTIEIEGTLRKPSVALDLSGAAGQAGAAAALGAILTPLAAILPFIDPGEGEDTECSGLFAQAGRSVKTEKR